MYRIAREPQPEEGLQRVPLSANLTDRQIFPVPHRQRSKRPKVIKDHIQRRNQEQRRNGRGDQPEGEARRQRD